MTKLAWVICGALGLGCGGRPSSWDTPYTPPTAQKGVAAAYGLSGSVAVLDLPLKRVTMLSSPSTLELASRSIGLGTDLVAAQVSADRKTLFALSRGVQPQRTPNDERPQLLLIDGGSSPKVSQTYSLTEPMEQLVLDPKNEWAVVYGGSGVVVNLNELVLVNLAQTGAAALSFKTLLSFGGNPKRFTFTAPLAVPGGEPRRFLLVERDSDLVLIDLAAPEREAVTVPLPSTDAGGTASSAQLAYDADSASIAVRVTGTTSVFMLQLAAPATAGQDFSVVTNLVDVGGMPSAIDFVHNSQGLRLVALVGSSAVLVDPDTATTQSVQMPAAFTGIRRITDELNPSATSAADGDVALLYGPNISKIAYFNLSGAPGALFRSIEPYDIGVSVSNVIDVPGETYFDHKILQTPNQQFYVLDLHTRESAPMKTNGGLTLEVAPNGERVWAYNPGQLGFASVDFATLHPVSLMAERQVSNVFEIESADGQRAAVALHLGSSAGIGATVLDAVSPSTAYARFYSGLELGGVK
ncbi:MAG TPA: hypothetical protein VER12_18555 [Polyangiaceae bacterium]|nr:hypothetical protein [Polyangiaceae bacterium]